MKTKGYYRLERQVGKFERTFSLGENADGSKAKAEFKNGILKIVIPRKEETNPNK